LRAVSERDRATWTRRVAPDPTTDPVGFAATAYSHPRWVVEALGEALAAAGDPDELEALLAADNDPPAVTLVARPDRARVDELPGERTTYSPYGVVSSGGSPAEIPAVAEGRAGVQDEGSQLVAHALAAAAVDGGDERWLDLCAGPGGKAALLAALAASRGARLVANDRQPHRAELVRRALTGAEGVEAVTVGDGTAPPWPAGSFDRVLVDAPCTGLGVLRRRPEARWRVEPGSAEPLAELQRELLRDAATTVRPGGLLVYSVCTLTRAETTGVAGWAAANLDGFTVVPPPGPPWEPAGAGARLLPHRAGTDGMFVCAFRRV
jgi:16S rRNA (cytosine967-C5)-methyltransferase